MNSVTTPEGAQLIPLTERQAGFTTLADQGLSYREIADQYGVSIGTVKTVLYGIRNRALSIAGERALTARQLEILCLVGAGFSNTEIADRLYISIWTVVNHLRMARERLGAQNRCGRTHLVMLAISQELLILDHDGNLLVPHAHRVAA